MTQIGRYQIVRRTGQTPLGTIYEAVDSETRCTVAIQATEEACSESLGRLSHPNIRNLLAVEQSDGRMFLILEHLDAIPVHEYASTQHLSQTDLLRILKNAAEALDHANSHGVSHPGLTPKHLLIDAHGVLKIAGFELPGLDALAFPSTNEAEREELESSIPYRAPEFLSGEYDISRMDQFALGAIAHELLTEKRLFESASPISAMAGIILGRTTALALVETRYSAAVRRVLERMLSPDPTLRYANCTLALEALESALVHKPASPTRVTDSPVLVNPSFATGAPSVNRPVAPAFSERISKERQGHASRLRWIVAATVVTAIAMAALILSQLWHQNATVPATHAVTAAAPETSVNPTPAAQNPQVVPPPPEPAKSQAAPRQPSRQKPRAKSKDTLQMRDPLLDQ
ncbi:MAG: serine/threonine protein kinase [Bryobacterales bacterium]|nr:serine/threonine protein kinase [Bryobacterales bacterium]